MAKQVVFLDTTTGETFWDTPKKTDVGLDKVDNTSDMEKPVSAAQQAAIDAVKIDPPLLGAEEYPSVPFKKSIFLKIFLVGSLIIILSFLLIKSIGLHIVKTRNTFRVEGIRIWKGEVKHRTTK